MPGRIEILSQEYVDNERKLSISSKITSHIIYHLKDSTVIYNKFALCIFGHCVKSRGDCFASGYFLE